MARQNIATFNNFRIPHDSVKHYTNMINPAKDKLYILAVNDNGYSYHLCRYDMAPVKTNIGYAMTSQGRPTFDGTAWKEIEVSAWAEELKKECYTCVFIINTEKYFCEKFASLFEGGASEVQANTLYFVKIKDGGVVLQKAV